MTTAPRSPHPTGMSRMELAVLLATLTAVFAGLVLAAMLWKRGSDRSATLMNIRNCQQAMRGHQGMNNMMDGGPFTRADLAKFMPFPEDIRCIGGMIEFDPGEEKVTYSPNPAINTDHLWLKLTAPGTENHVGRYGFKDVAETTGW